MNLKKSPKGEGFKPIVRTINVAVSEMAIILSGEVDHLWQKETAESVVQWFRPMNLENRIIVRERL